MQRVAVVGSGPAGFYTSKYILRATSNVIIDMFEQRPTPFGLVRAGVAPDHPEVKHVVEDFTTIAESPRFRFRGNVRIGDDGDCRVSDLERCYDAVVLATGASFGKRLHLPGSHTNTTDAWSFVQWYNGLSSNSPVQFPSDASVAVVGMGNVALDCARIMMTCDSEKVAGSDIAEHARQSLVAANIQRCEVIGRRGAMQSKFGNKELRELLNSPFFTTVVDPIELTASLNTLSQQEVDESRSKKRGLKIFEDMANAFPGTKRVLQLRFLCNPTRVDGRSLILERMTLEGSRAGEQFISGSGEYLQVKSDVLIESVGFKFSPLEDGLCGPLFAPGGKLESREKIFVSGWLKRGPTGNIASNIPDAGETAASVCAALARAKPALKCNEGLNENNEDPLMSIRFSSATTFEQWKKIQQVESERGRKKNKVAEKITDVNEMLRIMRE